MTAMTFDTLSASKRLRDAGVEERAADAIVELVQQSTDWPDISHLAAKADVRDMVVKADLAGLATKADIQDMVVKADIRDMVVKADLHDLVHRKDLEITNAAVSELRSEIGMSELRSRADLSEKLRLQALALMGVMTGLVGLATAVIKLMP